MATQVMAPVDAPPSYGQSGAAPWQSTGVASSDTPEEEEEGPNRRPLIITLSVVGALLVAAILFLVLRNMGGDDVGDLVAMPDVVGAQEAAAKLQIESAGLVPVRKTEVPKNDEPAGTVIRTDPVAGKEVPRGSEAAYYVSTGPDALEGPNVVGQPEQDARKALEDAGFVVQRESEDSLTAKSGEVTRTDPAAGTALDEGATVTIYVSTGRGELPDVTGLPQATAEERLRTFGVQSITIVEEASDQAPGTVIRTNPPARTLVQQNTPVTLTIATAPTTVAVPNVLGKSTAEARSLLNAAGFTNITEQQVPSDLREGQVDSTNPSPGTRVDPNTQITLYVSLGPPDGG
jgi:serine/threonine-protein kinase